MAPNKPLLVLAILDLVKAGLVGPEGLVHKDAELSLRFRSYSPICVPRRGNGIDLNLPFRHLASDGVYSHVGEEERTVKLDQVLLASMRVPAWRQEAREGGSGLLPGAGLDEGFKLANAKLALFNLRVGHLFLNAC